MYIIIIIQVMLLSNVDDIRGFC